MLQLTLFNLAIIAVITPVLILLRRKVTGEKGQNICFLVAALATIVCHYSSILYHFLTDGSQIAFLESNPNLLLPIYPCNLVMWCCLFYALLKNKESGLGRFLADYIFWFGLFSCLVGMFANVDFIRNPTLENYDVTKGILAHGFMLFNVLLMPVFKKVGMDLLRNIKHIFFSILLMLATGLYCNLIFTVVASRETAYNVNSMFLIHSPFEGLDFLTYPLISAGALVLYFILFAVADLFIFKKGGHWYERLGKKA